ncbi:MAG: hypothetical protein IK015_11120 [Treponema sp.]|nr:hypothetical protein [Treponema sp.]
MSAEKILQEFNVLSKAARLPSKKQILDAAKKALFVLATEPSCYRERIPGTDVPGGLLDFRAMPPLATIVVPDIHARPDFVYNILNFELPQKAWGLSGLKVIEALEQNKVRVICVGDILHAEGRAKERWLRAYQAFEGGVYDSAFMRAEMREGLAALIAVMRAKILWPENFHCLKGNHENIRNERGGGNFPFRKFAYEGRMVFEFMKTVYDEQVVNALYDFEKALPLCACSSSLFVSHAEPLDFYSKDDLVCAPLDDVAVYGLTWTANDEAREGSVAKILSALCEPAAKTEARAIGGHRPVPENYLERQDGLYVQIHNPKKQNIALVRADKTFNPKNDIISVADNIGD